MTLPPVSPLALLVAGAFFMEFLDGTIIVTALPRMAESLQSDPVSLHVGISAYLLTVAIFILPGGWAADRFGARKVFTAAIVLFTVSSALCGLSRTLPEFVAARVLQGIGGAMMVPVGRLVVLRATAKPDLMNAIATLTWPGLSAPLLGPPLGGFIAEHLSWRLIFFVNLPLGAVATLLALRLVPRIPTQPRTFDGLGFVLAAATLLCISHALDLLSAPDPPLPFAALLLFLTAAGSIGFVRHLRRHPHPLLDPAPWAVPTFRLVMTTGTATRTTIAAMPFLLPLLFQLGFGVDPFHAGLLVLVLFAGNLGIKPLTSAILRRWGFRTVLGVNAGLQAACMACCAMIGSMTPLWLILPLLLLAGASRSTQFTGLNTLAFADVPQTQMGPANTWFSVAFQLSNGFGVAIGALLLRVAGAAFGPAAPLPPFHAAFAALAVITAGLAAACLTLPADAGAAVSGHSPRR